MIHVEYTDFDGETFAILDWSHDLYGQNDRLTKRDFDRICLFFNDATLFRSVWITTYKLPFIVDIRTNKSNLKLYVDFLPMEDGTYIVNAFRMSKYGNFDVEKDCVFSRINRDYDEKLGFWKGLLNK